MAIMKGTKLYKLSGALLILTTLGFNGLFTSLSINFEYPDILRFPTGYVLEQYHAGGSILTLQWYGMVIVSILFIPMALFMHRILADEDIPYLGLATTFGVLAGAVNVLGFIRWVFVVPHLARVYVDPASSEATKEAVTVVFEAFHLYAGFAIGEHLGYMFIALWAGLLSVAMFRLPLFKPWLGWLGLVAAVLVFFGITEGAGVEAAGLVNVIGFALWSLWLIITGIFLLRAKPEAAQQTQVGVSPVAAEARL
jgi:hypothetical protein